MSGSPSVPQRLGKYWIVAPLGQGGMARVDLAVERGADDVVVLKQLHESLESHSDVTKRFLREAKVASLLNHPNIARVLDAGVEEGHRCIAMEFVAGVTFEELNQKLWKTEQAFPAPYAVAVIRQLLEALEYAHALTTPEGKKVGLVHRDLSTKNLLLDFTGEAQIIDFGIAKGEVDDHRTATGMLMGTPLYMSPEQAMGERVDRRSDLYTLGVVLWELLAGRRLVQAKGRPAMLRAVVAEPAPPLPDGLPSSLQRVLHQALQKDREQRFQTATEFLQALVPVAAELGLPSSGELSQFAITTLPRRKAEIDHQVAEAMRVAQQEGLTRMAPSPLAPDSAAAPFPFAAGPPPPASGSTSSPFPYGGSISEAQYAPPTDWGSATPSLARPPNHRTGLWMGMSVVLLLASAGGVWWLSQNGADSGTLRVTPLQASTAAPTASAVAAAPSLPTARALPGAPTAATSAQPERPAESAASPSRRRKKPRSEHPAQTPKPSPQRPDPAPEGSQTTAPRETVSKEPPEATPQTARLRSMLRRYVKLRDRKEAGLLVQALRRVPGTSAAQRRCVQDRLGSLDFVTNYQLVEEVRPVLEDAIACLE